MLRFPCRKAKTEQENAALGRHFFARGNGLCGSLARPRREGGRGGSGGKTEKKREKTGERYEKLDVKMQCLLYILLRKIDS